MNISMSIVQLQLIDYHSTFFTVLIENDSQSLQSENTFFRKSFHTQSLKYLLVHRYSNQLRTAFRTRVLLVCHLVLTVIWSFYPRRGGLRKTMGSGIDRTRRDLSDTIIEFVGTNSGMNRHNFYSKFGDLGGVLGQ